MRHSSSSIVTRIANRALVCVLLVTAVPRVAFAAAAADADAATRQAAATLVDQVKAYRVYIYKTQQARDLRGDATDLLAACERFLDGLNDDASSDERNQKLRRNVRALAERTRRLVCAPLRDLQEGCQAMDAAWATVTSLDPQGGSGSGNPPPPDPAPQELDYDQVAVGAAVDCALDKAKVLRQELKDHPQGGDKFAALQTDVDSIVSLLKGMKSQVEDGVKRSVLRKTLKNVRGRAKQIAGKMKPDLFGVDVSHCWNDLQNAVIALAGKLPAGSNNAAALEAAQETIADQADAMIDKAGDYDKTLQEADQTAEIKAMRKALAALDKALGRVKSRAEDDDADADAMRNAIDAARAAQAAAAEAQGTLAERAPALKSSVISRIGEALDAMRGELP